MHGFGLVKENNSLLPDVKTIHVQGGGVPGGHLVIAANEPGRKPFITPMRECHSIPLRHSDVVVDIGAYVGTYAIACARFPVKRVDAYEPTPYTFSILSQTKLPNLRLHNMAVVGGDERQIKLFISAGIGVTNSIKLSNRKASATVVPAISYQRAVQDATVVKIDVEGAEYDYPIVQPGLRAVIIDFHPVPGDWISHAKEIVEQLGRAGFEAVISPDFSNGWTRAGSWARPLKTEGEFEPMMSGKVCCGCGARVLGRVKSLCPDCWESWLPQHRKGFGQARCKPSVNIR